MLSKGQVGPGQLQPKKLVLTALDCTSTHLQGAPPFQAIPPTFPEQSKQNVITFKHSIKSELIEKLKTPCSTVPMAATTIMTSQPPTSTTPSPLPSRNPLPLSASQESQVRELYFKRVRTKCANEVRGTFLSPTILFDIQNRLHLKKLK